MRLLHYFDHNATAPMSPVARQVWMDAALELPGNPSSLHRIGSRADKALEDARQELASILGCTPLDVVWTSSASESNNAIWYHLSQTLDPEKTVWVSAIEHPCCLDAARHWLGDRCRWIPVTTTGEVDVSWMEANLETQQPGVVCVMAANNETGILQPWETLHAWCQSRGIAFFCDVAQWMGRLPAQGLGQVEWLSGCGHKHGGPKGVGFIKCPPKGRFTPLLLGGPQEMNRRAGTENVAGILSMVAALKDRESSMTSDTLEERAQWRNDFENKVRRTLPGSRVLGESAKRLWNTSTLLMPEMDCRMRWVVKLDRQGFAVSTGSACSSGQEKPSHVMEAMGLTPNEAGRVVRFSAGWETTPTDWEGLHQALMAVYQAAQRAEVAPKESR